MSGTASYNTYLLTFMFAEVVVEPV